MDGATVKPDGGVGIARADCYNDTLCNSKSHAERVHLGGFGVRDDLEYAREVAGGECFRVFHLFSVMTLFRLRTVQ